MQIVSFQVPPQCICLNYNNKIAAHSTVNMIVRSSTLRPYPYNENTQNLNFVLGQVTSSLSPFRGDHFTQRAYYLQVIT